MKKLILIGLPLVFFSNSCVKENEYVVNKDLNPDDIIKFASISPYSVYADSVSDVTIRIRIYSNSDSAQNILLATNKGLINGKSNSEQVLTNLNRYVDFILTAGQVPGKVSLRASVLGSYTRDTIIHFLKAYPDSVIVTPDSFKIPKNTELSVSVIFFSKIGYPSKNQSFLFSAVDSAGNSIGLFSKTGDYIPGNVLKANFSPEEDYTGLGLLQVIVVKEDGGRIVGTAKISVQ